MSGHGRVTAGLTAVLAILSVATEAGALAQWSRKYQADCTLCHTAFPRLNAYGEQFALNGFQVPGSEDGDEANIPVSDRLALAELANYFGVRISLTPLSIKTNDLTKNGDKTTRVSVGNPNWLQLFTGGAIHKNVSIFIETEVGTEDGAGAKGSVKNNWFTLGYHNLGGSTWGNLRVGQIDPIEWGAAAGRLRMIPNVSNQAFQSVKAAKGKGEDAVPVAYPAPAIDWYGYNDRVLLDLGVTNGAFTTDKNGQKNVWGTVRVEDGKGEYLTFHVQYGVNTDSTATNQIEDKFYRIVPGLNVRRGNLDFIASYIYAKDDNWNLSSTAPAEVVWQGWVGQAGYSFNESWWGAIEHDWVGCDDDPSVRFHAVYPSLWFFPRQEMRIGATAKIDLLSEDAAIGHPKKLNEFALTVRSMF